MSTTATENPITTPRSVDELTKLAGSQIDSEISGQVDPLKYQISDLQGRETSALQQIGSLFGGLQPYVTSEADKVQGSYDTAFGAAQSIFQTAQQRMNQLKNQRAQDAQNMAQQVGGPVSVGEFTSSVLPAQEELAATAPNSLIHMLGDAQAGEQEARAFSEKVFPLTRTEEESKARANFEDQIKQITQEIATIQGSRQGALNTRLNDLLTQERTFQQGQAAAALDKLKSNRDWQATKRTLTMEQQRLTMAQNQWNLTKRAGVAGLTGVDPVTGKPTMAAVKLSVAEKQAAQRLGISQQALAERIRHDSETEAVSKQRVANNQNQNAMKILDYAMSPSSKSTLTLTHKVPLTAAQALITKGARKDVKKNQWYYYEKRTLTPQQALAQGYNLGGNQPITDPNQLYTILTGARVPPAMAQKLIRIKTGLGDWSPGADVHYTVPSLAARTNADLLTLAKQRGYKHSGHAGRNDLIHYIISQNVG